MAASGTDAEERLLALKFFLHFIGDLFTNPFNSADNHDRGGNSVKVMVDGFPHKSSDELHGFWDTQFVDGIAKPPATLAKELLAKISPGEAKAWTSGTIEDWQKEAFNVAKTDVYGHPPFPTTQTAQLDADYVKTAEKDTGLQLSRAGIRLAYVLNQAQGPEDADWSKCLTTGFGRKADDDK